MATNFKITQKKERTRLHLTLKGDFDGTSAYMLMDILKKKYPFFDSVYIYTDSLGEIHQFGIQIFERELFALDGNQKKVLFFENGQQQSTDLLLNPV